MAGAGVLAGAVNAVVGSGSLITFPTLLAVGYAPVTANVSNTVGLVFGGISGAWGYRRELRGQRRADAGWRAARRSARWSAASSCSSCRARCSTRSSRSLILLAVALMAFKPTPKHGAEHDH